MQIDTKRSGNLRRQIAKERGWSGVILYFRWPGNGCTGLFNVQLSLLCKGIPFPHCSISFPGQKRPAVFQLGVEFRLAVKVVYSYIDSLVAESYEMQPRFTQFLDCFFNRLANLIVFKWETNDCCGKSAVEAISNIL